MDAVLRRTRVMRTVSLAALVLASTISLAAGGADPARKSFVASWQGKRVAVKRTMYTLVFNERGKLGKTYQAKREGLTVVTPSAGTYCRFDGRDSEGDIVGREPQEVIDQIAQSYRRQLSLDIGFYLRIEPVRARGYRRAPRSRSRAAVVRQRRARQSGGRAGDGAHRSVADQPVASADRAAAHRGTDSPVHRRWGVRDELGIRDSGFGTRNSGLGIREPAATLRRTAHTRPKEREASAERHSSRRNRYVRSAS